MSDDVRIDPRYDPVFQRGHADEHPVTPIRPRAAALPEQTAPAPQGAGAGAPFPAQPVLGAGTVDGLAGAAAGNRESVEHAPVVPGPAEPPAAPRGPELRGNPFVIALWAIGALLVLGSVAAQWQAASAWAGTDGGSPGDFIWLQMLGAFAPWGLVLGVATLVALLLVHALHWRPAGDE